jgi:hypothetical protein
MSPLTPAYVLADTRAADLLGWPFDIELDPALLDDKPFFRLADGTPYELVAGDGAGNYYALLGAPGAEPRPLLYVCHEGQAGVIGRSFEEAIRLIVDLPYWRDLVKFSGGGDLAEMRRAWEIFEREMPVYIPEEEPGIDELRAEVREALSLTPLPDPVATLHANVTAYQSSVHVVNQEGEVFESLFGDSVYGGESGDEEDEEDEWDEDDESDEADDEEPRP